MGKIKEFVCVILYGSLCYLLLFSVLVGIMTVINKKMIVYLIINSLFVGIVTSIVYLFAKKLIRRQ